MSTETEAVLNPADLILSAAAELTEVQRRLREALVAAERAESSLTRLADASNDPTVARRVERITGHTDRLKTLAADALTYAETAHSQVL
ncbi:hypothetical protein [Streptomyces hydrogenans]|uniref:hypothetical protein n=1 Tax=Streptomyces hydrogenans TaxID=1873719 RepID=UPI00380C47F2